MFLLFGILLFYVLIGSSSNLTEPVYRQEPTFCDGWKDGYCEGWKDVKGEFVICPITPLCPLPEVNRDTYNRGFARGFKQGKIDAQ